MKCDYCSKTFNSMNAWVKHIDQKFKFESNKIKPYCLNCNYVSKNMKALKIHIKSRVCRNDMPKDQCKYCSKCFTNRGGLQKHYDINSCLSKNPDDQFMLKTLWDYSDIQLFENVTQDDLDIEFNQDVFDAFINNSNIKPLDLLDTLLYSMDDDEPITYADTLLVTTMII